MEIKIIKQELSVCKIKDLSKVDYSDEIFFLGKTDEEISLVCSSNYNPAFRAHISSKGKLPIPVGYYIKIQPGNRSFLGGGLFADIFKDATDMIRDSIVMHGDEWSKIINEKSFLETFISVKGECLKNVPRGYDPLHPQAEYLRNKSWYLEYPISDELLQTDSFITFAADIFMRMQPFNAFLNNALMGFVMPKR